jgi:hypothetical protein
MKWFLMFALLLVSGILYAQTPFWSAKFVMNYTAIYPNTKPVHSWALVEIYGMDRTYSPSVITHADCESAAWMKARMIAAQRNPGAKSIAWTGWAGRCWQGAKPPEPIAWSTFAHGTPW